MGAAKPEDQAKQSCCLGLLYFSTALQNKGRRPVSAAGQCHDMSRSAKPACDIGKHQVRRHLATQDCLTAAYWQVCLGIPHKPGSQVQLEGRSQVTDGYTDFKVRVQVFVSLWAHHLAQAAPIPLILAGAC